jgi:hypothetical protein
MKKEKLLLPLIAAICFFFAGGGCILTIGSTVSPDGIWEGKLTEDGRTIVLTGFFSGGRFLAFSETGGVVFDGPYRMHGSRISGRVRFHEAGRATTANISGFVTERSRISMTFDTASGRSGNIFFSFDAVYDTPSSFAFLTGDWHQPWCSRDLALLVQGSGGFSGQDNQQCEYNGAFRILDSGHNLYGVTLIVTSCSLLEGAYSGFSSLSHDATMPLVVANDSRSLFFRLSR